MARLPAGFCGLRPLMIYSVNFFSMLPTYVSKTFNIWLSGRNIFKTVRWTIKAIDETNQLTNITNTSIVKSMPEPLVSAYQLGLYIYPDWDSNFARAGSVLKETNSESILTTKGWFVLGASSLAIIHELIRDKAIIAPIDAIKKSTTDTCKYNISAGDKWYFQELQSNSPEWYAFTHVIGERIVNPLVFAYLDGSPQGVVTGFLTSAAYLSQDLTRFRLIERDLGTVLNYTEANPECVYLLRNDTETVKINGDTLEYSGDL